MTFTEARKAIRAARNVFIVVHYTEDDTFSQRVPKSWALDMYKGLKGGTPKLYAFGDGDVVIG